MSLWSKRSLVVAQGNFERAIETAGEHGQELKHKYVALQATNFIRDGKSLDALKLYRRHSAPPYEQASIRKWASGSGLTLTKITPAPGMHVAIHATKLEPILPN